MAADQFSQARRERHAAARRQMLREIDRICLEQRRRIQGRLQGMSHRIQAARRGGEYGDDVIVSRRA